ncbi:VPS4-associated protein 1 [Yarrowia lipolytica]|jgi:hypothetical protein|uniref:YALI0D19250p n=2 Tax=Yarrowia lipolytica TaxID=4952 RepID=Q6C8I9_YARLI|nr:YALI0D19250p [Yarrowia lipolytica CLIB122]AOW04306.1 hypothetical protein YALI1_D24387g [Yarrowia lipolytica]KAB8280458.1 VPS4-associated protein 1 [Yarrowia lipolytica]KAE8169538.1 VPS4-associated protein 1 [Yarrowia lipolytica]KAJ8054193.1 VPS4-associated protein 1 [Yarrowia lipolytica]QNP97962.1 UPF0589 protein [Yarrowia lipolytica]|eukprot:XP_503023.1 YALI0D19250p [Yarrowia lipolytica CLIB122]
MENDYTLRQVAENASKACYICYRPSAHVLIDKSNTDFFYICKSHLTDKGFATRVDPPVDTAAIEAELKKKQLEAEKEKVKKEWEDAQKKKSDKNEEEKDKEDAEKVKEMILKDKKLPEPEPVPESRKYTLHPTIYTQRVRQKKELAAAKKRAEHIKTMQFPGVPKGLPGEKKEEQDEKKDDGGEGEGKEV